jgi:hypothetical protein
VVCGGRDLLALRLEIMSAATLRSRSARSTGVQTPQRTTLKTPLLHSIKAVGQAKIVLLRRPTVACTRSPANRI